MFPLGKAALSVSARGVQRIAARHCQHKAAASFHDKYGNAILASGLVFCVSVWSYVLTQTGITWNFSPVGKITPKEWREK